MGNTIIVVGCTKLKESFECEAEQMYSRSVLFSKTVNYAKKNYTDYNYVILSAKYGVLNPTDVIVPYDISMNEVKKDIGLYSVILNNIKIKLRDYDTIIALCGTVYVDAIRKSLPEKEIITPMRGMGIGKRLRFLSVK